MTYAERLKDPRWQKRRLEILQRDGWSCRQCRDAKSTLHVHHKRYLRGHDPWEYEDDDLITLCEGCHEHATRARKELEGIVARLSSHGVDYVVGFAHAIETWEASVEELPKPANTEQLIGMQAWVRLIGEGRLLELYRKAKQLFREAAA